MEAPLPRTLEKRPSIRTYDGIADPDDHLEDVEATLDYHNASGAIRCRFFPMTLRQGAKTWYNNLPPRSIHSWTELKRQFVGYFTASWRHPKSEASLEAIVQGADEPLWDYIDHFNCEAIQVDTTDDMKKYLLEKGLYPGSKF